jgi:GTPase SAR1 family protein
MIGTDMQLKIWLKVPTEEELDTVDLQNLINAVVIVFDVTNKASFDQLIKWVRLSSHFSNGILVGNKSDLSKNRQVSSQDAEMMAIRYDMKYIEVSSKTRRGIPDLMDKIVDIIGPDESSLRLNR